METINKKLEKNVNVNNKNININENNRYIDNNLFINYISENITKKKTKKVIHKFEDYFIFWN